MAALVATLALSCSNWPGADSRSCFDLTARFVAAFESDAEASVSLNEVTLRENQEEA